MFFVILYRNALTEVFGRYSEFRNIGWMWLARDLDLASPSGFKMLCKALDTYRVKRA
jgi:hypothetical protein